MKADKQVEGGQELRPGTELDRRHGSGLSYVHLIG